MNLGRICQVALLLPVFAVLTVAAKESSDLNYAAVPNNDISSLRTRLKGSDVNLRDNYGTTPLRYAAVGSRTHAPEDAQ